MQHPKTPPAAAAPAPAAAGGAAREPSRESQGVLPLVLPVALTARFSTCRRFRKARRSPLLGLRVSARPVEVDRGNKQTGAKSSGGSQAASESVSVPALQEHTACTPQLQHASFGLLFAPRHADIAAEAAPALVTPLLLDSNSVLAACQQGCMIRRSAQAVTDQSGV